MTKKQEQTQVEINALEKIARDNSESTMTDEEIRKIEVTDILFQEIQETIKAKELINIQILGEVIHGKSTLALFWGDFVNMLLGKEMTIKYIARDQIEFLRKTREEGEKYNHAAIVIDEFSSLGEVGANATTDEAALNHFSDLMAQLYLHRISCAPKTITDPNANIILEVINKDTKTKTTICLVYYRLFKVDREIIQLIGHANIYVGDILNRKWYKEYRERKFKRMELVNKYGIKDEREIEQAKTILKVYEDLKQLARMGLVKRDTVSNFIEVERRKEKNIYSIITTEDLINKTYGILNLEKQNERLNKEIEYYSKKAEEKPEGFYRNRILEINKAKEQIHEAINVLIENYKAISKLQDKIQEVIKWRKQENYVQNAE